MEIDLTLLPKDILAELTSDDVDRSLRFAIARLRDFGDQPDVKGWLSPRPPEDQLALIRQKAAEIREQADVFVLVGVGGSNQGAQAVIGALAERSQPEVIYAGNTLSAYALRDILNRLNDRSVYLNVIAKNFATLEPGSHFRVLRQWMAGKYTGEEMARRVVVTGSRGSRLHQLADANGHLFLDFPPDIGGRFSAHSVVGLLPMAVAGIDIELLLQGAEDMARQLELEGPASTAASYAAARCLLYQRGFKIEVLAAFEPQLRLFGRWWRQLFGESEGKEHQGIFPATVIYSEDLHSMGQYLQDGERHLFETFLCIDDPQASVLIKPDRGYGDDFDYLDGFDFARINKIAEQATLAAHADGGVPCIPILLPRLDPYVFGQLFYFFEYACALSGFLTGINPFDQEGVEEYKQRMLTLLKGAQS